MLRWIPILLLTSACHQCAPAGNKFTSPSPIIEAEWAIGQLETVAVIGDKAYEIWPHHFHWQEEPGPFMCGKILANGCYSSSKLIRWNIQTPTVIRHEAGHAILHKAGVRWREWQHDY